jgi:UDP-N-acetyl-2-amino-2-deoxyglucuronate dehydrogenase
VPCEASLEALLERPDVDAVCLCSPSGLHAQQAVAAARAARHVLVEKPMALCLADADAMIAACRDAGVQLGVALQRRTDPASRALHDAIREGELGDLVMGTATSRTSVPRATTTARHGAVPGRSTEAAR